jgi:hypothetical protein
MIGKLEPVDLREVWSREAKDFTTWLFDNMDILSDHVGIELTALEREKSVGPFYVDIWAEDSDGKSVIIENQLEKTDHDHLGKLLTYLSNLGAKKAIWITSEPRPEHTVAMNYLNEVVPEDTNFYLIKAQAFRIGGSDPAPLFAVVAGPSPGVTAGGKVKKEFAGREQLRFKFFEQLLEQSNTKTSLFSNISPTGYQNWLMTGVGKSGLALVYVIRQNDARVELLLNHSDPAVNERRFKSFQSIRPEVEANFGESLDWDYNENRKQQYIRSWCEIGGLLDETKWPDIQKDLIDRMLRMEKLFRHHLSPGA